MSDALKLSGAHRVIFALAVALHVALLFYYTPPSLLKSGTPISTYDYGLHVYQVDRAQTAFSRFGHLWSYDPFVLAGQPAGVVEDLTSKSLEVFVILLGRLGIPLAFAFNAYIVLVHVGVPFAGRAAARLLGLDPTAAAVTALSWTLLWFFDSFLHWCWYVGMISWAASSYLTVLLVALGYRTLTRWRFSTYVMLCLTAMVLTLVHPFAVLTVLLPLGICYALVFRRLSLGRHAALWASALIAGSTVLVWIGPALRFRHYIGDVDAFLRPPVSYVVYDWLDFYLDVLMTGQPVRTMLRVLAFAGAAVVLVRWRRDRDPRFWPLVALIGGCIVMAYTSGYFWMTRQTQPYRQLGPAALAAAMVASPLCCTSLAPASLRTLRGETKLALGLSALLLAPRLVQTVLQYLPTLLPATPAVRARGNVEQVPLIVLGHGGPETSYREVARFIESVDREHPRGRAVVLDWALAEYMAARSTVPILGGIPQRNVPHVDAHLLHHDLGAKRPGDDSLARYFEEYAVGYVVTTGAWGSLDDARHLLEPLATFGEQRVYRVKREPTYFAEGRGRVVAQGLNDIRVIDASGGRVVLRFHWMETLRCEPGCTVERVPTEGDRIGFVGIPAPPREFRIYSAYD